MQELTQQLKVSTIFFKRNKRSSWKQQRPIEELTVEILLDFYKSNRESPFEFRTFLVEKTVMKKTHEDLLTQKKYLTVDYYGCIQFSDGRQEALKEIEVVIHKDQLEEVLEILGLHEMICD
ncbi:Hypothetical_protein [Hexamita inflata]|uniref:Hypothetical_protein n=1 Tax=Hexamita inflata TaxID=28002 RepID=A0ABP1GGE5_9EUKA